MGFNGYLLQHKHSCGRLEGACTDACTAFMLLAPSLLQLLCPCLAIERQQVPKLRSFSTIQTQFEPRSVPVTIISTEVSGEVRQCSFSASARPALKCAPQLAPDVGSSVDPIVASFHSHQPAQAKKAEQSDPAIVVMIIPVSRCPSGSLVGRAGR